MLLPAAGFAAIAIVAGVFGFGGIVTGAADIAKVICGVFVVGVAICMVIGMVACVPNDVETDEPL